LKKRKLKINQAIFWTLAACFFSACSTRPSYVLSEKKMENVLYDLYLVEAAIEEHSFTFNNDSAAKQDLLNSVFEKHKITAQKFDTSLVWYNQNMERYLKINTKVGERLSVLSEDLTSQVKKIETEKRQAEIRNLFPATTSFFLQSPGFFQNRSVFRTDSVQLKSIRSYHLSFDVLGVTDSIYPVLSFFLQTADTIFVNRDTIRTDGLYSKTFSVPNSQKVKEIYGSFYIPDEEKALILIKEVTLLKQENEQLNKEDRKIALQRKALKK
jgi:hypothetical protein